MDNSDAKDWTAGLEELIMLLDFDGEGRIAVSEQIRMRIKRKQIEISRKQQREWLDRLPFKKAPAQNAEVA